MIIKLLQEDIFVIYLDESGLNDSCRKKYGWQTKGKCKPKL